MKTNVTLSPADTNSKRQMATACKILYVEGQNDFNHGQISARRQNGDQFWIRAAARGFDEIGEEDFILTDSDGRPIIGEGHIPPEWPIHAAVYQARPDVKAIVHTHPKASIAFSALNRPIRPLSHDGAYFAPEVPVFSETTNTIVDMPMAQKLAKVIGCAKGALLKNHGIVTVGPTIREATMAALLLERAAELELKVAHHDDSSPSPTEDIGEKQDFIFGSAAMRTYWDYHVRKANRADANGAEGRG